jgi:membrane-bound inhibitor of C-type lysozyme
MGRLAAVPLIAAIGLTSCANEPKRLPENETRRVLFNCANGEQLEMRFFPAQGVAVLVRNGKTIELQQQPSGSGFIYSNGPNTVRGKGKDLSVEIGRMVPITCEAQ